MRFFMAIVIHRPPVVMSGVPAEAPHVVTTLEAFPAVDDAQARQIALARAAAAPESAVGIDLDRLAQYEVRLVEFK